MILNWISVKDRLPKCEEKVLVAARGITTKEWTVTTGMYEDGTMSTDSTIWNWEDLAVEYDETNDCYLIPEGWWEDKEYNDDDEFNRPISDVVVAWMPLPEPPRMEEETNE